ncbi:hypothetical protein [Egicoccus sp. AB-alg2]|uniref:hypothetical protein n=1 Tax=Egicoccus sp. AB-alg2 TaxID=3242693 RepID=UPI00359EA907
MIDAALEVCHENPARAACEALFGENRVTRPVVRSFARSILGAPGQPPGRNAALGGLSLLLAIDNTAAHGDLLTPSDLAEVLTAAAAPTGELLREPLRAMARERLAALLADTPRRRRVELAVELLHDGSGRTGRSFWRLRRMQIDVGQIYPLSEPTLDRLHFAVHLLSAETACPAVTPNRIIGTTPDRVVLSDGHDVRPLNTLAQALFESWQFDNCLDSRWQQIANRGHLLVTVHRHGHPQAAVQLDPAGDIREILGPANRPLELRTRRRLEHVLIATGLLPPRPTPNSGGPPAEVAARISCLAVSLLAHELDPGTDPRSHPFEGLGDRMLRLLHTRRSRLRHEEFARLHTSDQQQIQPCRQQPTGLDANLGLTLHPWLTIAAMLVASHISDPDLDRLDTSEACRRATIAHARQVLNRELTIPDRPPHPDIIVIANAPDIPAPITGGLREILDIWADIYRDSR